MSEGEFDMLDAINGIPDNEEERRLADQYYHQIKSELKKISQSDAIGCNLQSVSLVQLVIDKECKGADPPQYRLYINGNGFESDKEVITAAIKQFVEGESYRFYYEIKEVGTALRDSIHDYLKNHSKKNEYWCRLTLYGSTLSYKPAYDFIILCFNEAGLKTSVQYKEKRHPFLDVLKREWSIGLFNNIGEKKICYNEMFRRAAFGMEYFLWSFGNDFNALAAMNYEHASNKGSILAIKATREKSFDELSSNYSVLIRFSSPIKVVSNTYTKIRKLLEMTDTSLSLLMNGNGEIFGMGKMIEDPTCEFYQICFEGFLKWSLRKNNEKLLIFENLIPRIPDKPQGISDNDIELLRNTFNGKRTNECEKLINAAVSQNHGTMIVIMENACEEAKRLENTGIKIECTASPNQQLLKALMTIDGALICDADGKCYSIGTILDGKTSDKADSSRGARYNSAIRYIEQQKERNKKTFIVVVSDDGYINCFSSLE